MVMMGVLIITGLAALVGLALIAEYGWARWRGTLEDLEIIDFQDKKYLGRALPVVEVQDSQGHTVRLNIRMIDHMGYLISPPILRQVIPVLREEGDQGRVYGYLKICAGLILLFPFFTILAVYFSRDMLFQQVLYIGILGGIVLGVWIFLRWVGRNS
jgi:hypothetical protein